MAEGKLISIKRLKINKANQTIVAVVAVSSFIVIFCLVAIKSLASQYSYQNRVTSAQQKTVDQLQTDNQAATNLVNSYNSFVNQSTNIVGGSASGTANQDGPNSKIILDALPDTYDFPALATSIQNLISLPGISVQSITGTDTGGDSSTSSPSTTQTSSSSPIAIPFSYGVQGAYSNVQLVLDNVQRSIRPIQIQTIDLTGSDSQLTATVNAQTYYLPASGLSLTTENIQ